MERHGDDSPDWKSIIGANHPGREVYHSRIASIDKYERNIFSLRAGNNYVVEHAKRYPSFLRAITRKESFDRLVPIGKHDKRYPQDRKIACSSIIEDIFISYFEIRQFYKTIKR